MDKPVGAGPDRRTSTASTASSGSNIRNTASRKSFSSLESQKRSTDPAQLARRQSMMDQRPAPGMIGRWWNTYVYGVK